MYLDVKTMWEIEEALLKESTRLKNLAKLRMRLRENSHFHDFGYSRRCDCGMTEIAYARDHRDDISPCPLTLNDTHSSKHTS